MSAEGGEVAEIRESNIENSLETGNHMNDTSLRSNGIPVKENGSCENTLHYGDTHDELVQMVTELKLQNEFLKSHFKGLKDLHLEEIRSQQQMKVGGQEDEEVKRVNERIASLERELLEEKQVGLWQNSSLTAELAAVKEEIHRLQSEFSSYKARAHALLQKKDAELASAKDSEEVKALEEALKETEKEALQASAERDNAIQDLQAALANHVKELKERTTFWGKSSLMGPRWKGKGAEVRAQADPMSEIISRLKSSLIESNAHGLLSGCSILLAVEANQSDLLNRACFGRPVVTAEKEKQWFQLSMEEAFYLCYTLKCLSIHGGDNCRKTEEELWKYMTNKKTKFPDFFKAYSHLRTKNWVVRSGSQYGVEFVAYRHHPSLVHSEYAVLISTEGDGGENERLRIWSDVHCAVRLCGSIAKSLLVLYINKCGHGDASPSCVTLYSVEERVVARWSPKDCREDHSIAVNGN